MRPIRSIFNLEDRYFSHGCVRVDKPYEFAEIVINRVTDLRRGLDYLETRTDIDMSRMAGFAPSAGSILDYEWGNSTIEARVPLLDHKVIEFAATVAGSNRCG